MFLLSWIILMNKSLQWTTPTKTGMDTNCPSNVRNETLVVLLSSLVALREPRILFAGSMRFFPVGNLKDAAHRRNRTSVEDLVQIVRDEFEAIPINTLENAIAAGNVRFEIIVT
ncbi:hypothetical protein AVEN_25978-1 [Araneus ventricosus]|uniref:Uncharacterized protein n=1 Tax=Araneus ventricosus TaxID=182803 RepID=A0A4Y2FF06_ARAVE|nr:hypothetical protein AVEN_25978-1 [Araneus ventricosus]